VAAPGRSERPIFAGKVLFFQRFRPAFPVAKRTLPGYNISYFPTALSGLGRVPFYNLNSPLIPFVRTPFFVRAGRAW